MNRYSMMLSVAVLAVGCADPAARDDDREDADLAAGTDDDSAESEAELGELIDMSTVVGREADMRRETLPASMDVSKEIYGDDMRKRIENTTVPPYSSTVMVRSRFPKLKGMVTMCTGTMIAADAVLTAAHCVYNAEEYGGRASEVLVSPGAYVDKTGRQRALPGVGTMQTSDFAYPVEFDDFVAFTAAIVPYDYAVIRLPRRVDAVGTRTLQAASDPGLKAISMLGYHGDLCSANAGDDCNRDYPMFSAVDIVRRVRAEAFDHRIDLYGGASGAGISTGGASGPLIGIQSAQELSPGFNTAVRLTSANIAVIRRWAGLAP